MDVVLCFQGSFVRFFGNAKAMQPLNAQWMAGTLVSSFVHSFSAFNEKHLYSTNIYAI